MIYTRFHFINTHLRHWWPFPANRRFCVKVVFILIFFYALQIAMDRLTAEPDQATPLRTGLKALGSEFTLDGKPFTILSGAIHYFRVVPQYWEDRLLKLKAIGLNTVETYVPWNLHEPTPGNFNFDGIADIKAYIELAQRLGLFVIIRPGPYVCAEWEFGGLPSWLLRDPELKIRSFSPPYLRAVDDFFANLFPLLVPLQYSRGGPIIAFQVENEYGSFGDSKHYLKHLYNVFILHGISELLLTSESVAGAQKRLLPAVLTTINFQWYATKKLQALKEIQPDRPLMVMEFWPGWFDHWGEKHKVLDAATVVETVRDILKFGASINFYMFHGGTNFGFMNGANQDDATYMPTITSYDYDCPISETGDITPKYLALHKLLKTLRPMLHTDTITDQLHLPAEMKKSSYGTVMMTRYIDFEDIISLLAEPIESENVMAMEDLPINDGAGQSYGYILYRTTLSGSAEQIHIGDLRDYGQVFLDREAKGIIKWPEYNGNINIETSVKISRTLDIFVENCGRVNYDVHIIDQKKGIRGTVAINRKLHKHWKIFPFEFKDGFVKKLLQTDTRWNKMSRNTELPSQPAIFLGTFTVSGIPADTFLDVQGLDKGIAFINGHNLGRYWKIGPQETLYIPAPWLKKGENTVLIFEQHPRSSSRRVKLVNEHRLGPAIKHSS